MTPDRRSLLGCAFLIFAAPLFRVLDHVGIWHTTERYAFESVCDALATGCLLATLRDKLWKIPGYRIVIGSPFVILVPFAALAIMAVHPPWPLHDLVGIPLLNFGIAMLLDRYMRQPSTLIGRILNLKPIVWIGTLSYSLYLWQQLFVFRAMALPVKIGAIMACAACSNYFVERPFLELRTRIVEGQASRRIRNSAAAIGE